MFEIGQKDNRQIESLDEHLNGVNTEEFVLKRAFVLIDKVVWTRPVFSFELSYRSSSLETEKFLLKLLKMKTIKKHAFKHICRDFHTTYLLNWTSKD
jgi:hypothetical protein